jgi:predicted short-subunit dehydrogenase-like oxidoreductase (DUF2520 family)
MPEGTRRRRSRGSPEPAAPPRDATIILGRGRVGRALAEALARAGVAVDLRPHPASGEIDVCGRTVILAIPDPAIAAVASRLGVDRRSTVLHTAGARGREELAALAARGAGTGVMHPLVSFADPRHPPSLVGRTFLIQGDRRAVAAARRLAAALGARAVVAPIHGPGYHAAAALAANGSAALGARAVAILIALGIRPRDAEQAIGGLVASVGENVAAIGLPRALTGPIVRGDATTVRAHRTALATLDPAALATYDAISPAVLAVARAAGVGDRAARAVTDALTGRSGTQRRRPRRAGSRRRSPR